MKFSVSLRGARPPLPKARPAKRYRGIAEKPHRLARRARTARPTTARPSSMKTWEKSCVVIGISNREQNTSCHHADDLNSCPNIIPPSDAPTPSVTFESWRRYQELVVLPSSTNKCLMTLETARHFLHVTGNLGTSVQ